MIICTNLQSAPDKLEKIGDRKTKFYTKPMWIIGMGLIVFDGILDVATFGMAPASMLAPLASLVLVHNVILAPCLLKEKLDKKGLLATAVIICGSLLATIYAPHKTPLLSADYFYARWTSVEMIVFEICVIIIFLVFYTYVAKIVKSKTEIKNCVEPNLDVLKKAKKCSSLRSSTAKDNKNAFETIDADIDYAIKTKDIDVELDIDCMDEKTKTLLRKSTSKLSKDETYEELNLVEGEWDYNIVRFGYSFLSGLLGGQSIIFAKTVIELVKISFFGDSVGVSYMCFASIDFYVYLVAMTTVLIAQTNTLNLGLKYFEALQIVPVFITFYQICKYIGVDILPNTK